MSAPIQAKYRAHMNAVAEGLDKIFNPDGSGHIVFTLLVAETGKMEGGRVNYISNGQRDDMLCMMREYLARAEGRAPNTAGRA